jgi:thiol-disulfide isomerase/thioredoxin
MGYGTKIKDFSKSLLTTYYITNLTLALSYYILKNIPYVCSTVFESCVLEWREWEIFILLLICISVKGRKRVSALQYVNTICTFGKATNVILYWREGPTYAFIYAVLWFLHFVFLPQPVYKGPENIKYYRGTHLDNEIKSDERITWLVCYYTPWSPPSIDFAPIFSELSIKYGDLDNFRFAKLDVNTFPDIGRKHLIDTSSLSKQLPTVILFKNGTEAKRRPFIDSKGTIFPFIFSLENIVKEFDLNSVYYEAKNNPLVVRPFKQHVEEKKKN